MTAALVDNTALLVWFNTEAGRHNYNRPKSLLASMVETEKKSIGFDTPEEFEKARQKILDSLEE